MRIGPYEILERIGTGGMAEVFLARHQGPEGLERLVAVKRIVPTYARNPEIRAMFIDEARLLARLVHPYIVQIHDLHAARDGLWLVTEYIKGPDLRTLIHHARAGLPVEMAVRIGLDVAEALAYAHGRRDEEGQTLGVVHRDLKPSNVMVRKDGVVKLLDFGVAKARARLHQTQVGAIKGSLGYFAPEQIQTPGEIDRRADIFAFGVVLYEALTGHHPFGPLDGPPVVMRMLAGKCAPLRQRRPEITPGLEALVARCLAVEPAQRPQRMEDVAEALAEQLGRPITFARLGAYVRDGVPSSTMRVALPRFMDDDDPSISGVLDPDNASLPGVIPLDTLDLDDDLPPSHTAETPFDSLDIDGADPTTQMAAPTPKRPVAAVPVARPTARDGRRVGPLTDPGGDGATAVLDDDEMPTFVAEDPRALDDEMPTFIGEDIGEQPTMTLDHTGQIPLQTRRPVSMLVTLALAGVIAGLLVALVAALLAE